MLWCLILFILGVSLIVVEFFLPGAVCGITGAVLLVVSAGFGINANPEYTVLILMGEFLGATAGIVLGLYLLANTRLGQGLFLNTTLASGQGDSIHSIAAGATGRVLTALRPSGTIEINGERVDAVSDGDFILEGELVQVVESHGNRVVVQAATSGDVVSPGDQPITE